MPAEEWNEHCTFPSMVIVLHPRNGWVLDFCGDATPKGPVWLPLGEGAGFVLFEPVRPTSGALPKLWKSTGWRLEPDLSLGPVLRLLAVRVPSREFSSMRREASAFRFEGGLMP